MEVLCSRNIFRRELINSGIIIIGKITMPIKQRFWIVRLYSSSVTFLQAVESGCTHGTNHTNLPLFLFAAIAGPQPFKSCCQLTEDSSSRHRTILSTLAATLCSAPGRTRRRGGSSTCAGTAERTRRKRPGRASTDASSTIPNSERIADAGAACATSHALRLLLMRKPAKETQ